MSKEIKANEQERNLPRKFEATEHGYVTLPYNDNQFKSFIVGLLGKPQTIAKNFYGYFEIDRDTIINLHEILTQRINQQNEAFLVHFHAKIVFDDRSSILLNSIEALLSYNETRKIYPIGLHLTWNFMVKFNDKDVPEKQEIEVAIIDSGYNAPDFDGDPKIPYHRRGQGYINCTIKHTARTWGVDMTGILDNFFEGIIINRGKIRDYFLKHDEVFIVLMLVFFTGSAMIGGYFSFNNLTNKVNERIIEILNLNGTEILSADEKINILFEMSTNKEWNQYYFYLILFAFIMLFISIPFIQWTVRSFNYDKYSHILLTKEAYKVKESSFKSIRKDKMSFVLSILLSILCSVLANFLFVWLTQ